MNIYYNSRDILCKNPFGAVMVNREVLFRIFIFNDVYVEKVSLVTAKGERYDFSYEGCQGDYSRYQLQVAFPTAEALFYEFHIQTEHGGFVGRNQNGKLVLDETLPMFQQTVYKKGFSTPDWAKGKIMYQIFPDRFKRSDKVILPTVKNERILHENWDDVPIFLPQQNPYLANDYFGGNLKGITEQLDYLKKLGVGIIYLNPVFESGENHRYSTADYKKIDPYLGTEKDFVAFTKACKKCGIHVILDGVFSHTGADSVYFNKYGHYDSVGAYQSTDSPYYPWYCFQRFPDSYESWWGFKNLPNVREENECYLDFITNPENGVLKFWHDRGVDGWRLDVADELPDVFIDRLRQTVKELNPDGFVIGEVWEDASNKESYGIKRRYLLGDQLDSVMNYPFRTAILEYVKHCDAERFINSVMPILENYPQEVLSVLMNSLSTHDTRRSLTELGVLTEIPLHEQGTYRMNEEEYRTAKKLLKLATVLQFTLPGIPCIYYGDEVGLQGFADPYCRGTYPYGKEDSDLLEFYQQIGKLKTAYEEDFKTPLTEITHTDSILSFKRGELTVLVNGGEETALWKEIVMGKSVFSHESVLYNEYGILMPPKSYIIFGNLKED
ncbi:MAG: glycoside hydrolase family 13 protein [Clostridia bacterium]|nr:glycoside hydrolase family 13 protein [Clostridia bacterium]